MQSVNKYIAHLPDIIRSMFAVIQSVLAAFIGVQSEDKRQHDFGKNSPWPYILVGIIMTVILIFLLVILVRWITAN